MIGLALSAVVATVPAGEDRLVIGSKWHCTAVGLAEHYTAEFVIEPGRSAREKNLRILSTTGDIDLAGYGAGSVKADHFDKNGSDLVLEFGQGFYNYGFEVMAHWDRTDPLIYVDVTTSEPRPIPSAERHRKFYGLTCTPSVAERG